ncbi:DUF4127 family protein [Paenibacillus sp.]|uniref:DUF4127 family protein n=1 Tax=Paenibacillus sp. TaxID=58172 RepID=UPI002D3FE0A3|nr:DUF4127 family protein [Paenibacillus sp.]HZG86899.1 DUF4127 family protein [Paenibacillus sp.]
MLSGAKIVYVPLDERPCNYEFPYLLGKCAGLSLVRPGIDLMGRKKIPADVDALWAWLERECADADGAILSLDTLLYGGLVPSRLHRLSAEACAGRLTRLRELKRRNPRLTLFAIHLIMRCPQYSSSDEEPDYYEHYGRELFRKGYLAHRRELGIADEAELAELAAVEAALPRAVEDDYLGRRAINVEANRAALAYVEEGVIDFLAIPQDDAAPYGWTAKDQQRVREEIGRRNAELRALMYPGADEAGCTLLARMINRICGAMPLVYPRMSGAGSPFVTPLYEDRPLFESVKLHILAAGGQTAASAQEADLLLLVNAPGAEMAESNVQDRPSAAYQVLRNAVELVEFGAFAMRRFGKPVAVADVAYANGGDLQLLKLLRQQGVLFDLAGYAGWNTSSNSLGTAIAQLMMYGLFGRTEAHLDFLALRFAEDFGYCAVVRKAMAEGPIPEMGMSYFAVDGPRGRAAEMAKERLRRFVQAYVDTDAMRVEIVDVYMPWSRMFEAGMTAKAVLRNE